jgi:hypothetical protein
MYVQNNIFYKTIWCHDRLYGHVVRVPGCGSRCPVLYSQHYQILWEVVGLERGPLSLVSITEELLDRKVAATVKKSEITAVGIHCVDNTTPLYLQNLAPTSPTSSSHSVGIVCSWTRAV